MYMGSATSTINSASVANFSVVLFGAETLDLSANGIGSESTVDFWLKFLTRVSFEISFLRVPNCQKRWLLRVIIRMKGKVGRSITN